MVSRSSMNSTSSLETSTSVTWCESLTIFSRLSRIMLLWFPFPAKPLFVDNPITSKRENRRSRLELREKLAGSLSIPVSDFPFLPQNELSVPRQVLLHLFVHFLVRHAGAAHLILPLHEDLPHFFVEPVFHGQLLEHSMADARSHRILSLDLNLLALHEALNHFTSLVFHDTASKQIYTLSLHGALPTSRTVALSSGRTA